jgi:Tfp pilus assembly protein PilV
MFNTTSNNKGIGLIEVVIALFLLSIGVLSVLSLQPSSWNLSGKADSLSRGGGLLRSELEANEILLMNPNFPNPCIAVNPLVATRTVFSSNEAAAQSGDFTFTVQTTILDNLDGTWSLRVRVTWPANNTGISESRVVTRQEPFRF